MRAEDDVEQPIRSPRYKYMDLLHTGIDALSEEAGSTRSVALSTYMVSGPGEVCVPTLSENELTSAGMVCAFDMPMSPSKPFSFRRNLTRPAVIKTTGVVIQPARLGGGAKGNAGGVTVSENGVATVAGGMMVQASRAGGGANKGKSAGKQALSGAGGRSKSGRRD